MRDRQENILIVDDDPEVLTALETELSEHYVVTAVMSAEQALACLQTRSFAAIVSDVRMPGVDGLSLIKQCAVRYPDMVRLILTAYDDETVQETALGPNGAYKLVKPWHDELLVTLENALNQRRGRMELKRDLDLKAEALEMDLRLHSKLAPEELISLAALEMARLPEVVAVTIYEFDAANKPILVREVLVNEACGPPEFHPKRVSPTQHKDHYLYSVPIGYWPRPRAAIALRLTAADNEIIRYLDFVGRQTFRSILVSDLDDGAPTSRSTDPSLDGLSSRPDDGEALTLSWLVRELASPTTVIVSAVDGLKGLAMELRRAAPAEGQSVADLQEIALDLNAVSDELNGLIAKLKSAKAAADGR
jgi:DNA-binding response OmpR family regulator